MKIYGIEEKMYMFKLEDDDWDFFKNIAENSPVLVREMNRLFLFSEAKILVCLQKHLSRCMMI